MRLVFTKDVGSNFRAGVVKDYPKSVWSSIAKSANQKLEKFTVSESDFAKKFKGK